MPRLPCLLLFVSCSCLGFEIRPLPLPDQGHSSLPRLHTAPDGLVRLIWVERLDGDGGHRLRKARLDVDSGWSTPMTVAEGRDWFVNWADFPSLAVATDGSLWAHWLRRLSSAPYAYEVRLSRSSDDGHTWAPDVSAHDDGTETEHGFVSLLRQDDGAMLVAWLDGRDSGNDDGAMTLRAARFRPGELDKSAEWRLDGRTCDCCQTSAAMTAAGPVVVYRGRDPGEIRDIKTTRFDGQAWTAPRVVHDDRWFMPACPVNGPAASAEGHRLWVAWHTVADGIPTVRLAASSDAGDHFDTVVDAATGGEVLGRVALIGHADAVWLTWLSEADGEQRLWLARHAADLSGPATVRQVAVIAGRGRGSGFPSLALHGNDPVLVWTEPRNGVSTLRGVRIDTAGTSTRNPEPARLH